MRPRKSTPAPTLSIGEAGSRWRLARFVCTHSHVPGITCMTPRALEAETIALLKPLSCQATAAARSAGTPLRVATALMSAAVTRPDVATGVAAGPLEGCGEASAATGEPVGSFSAVP